MNIPKRIDRTILQAARAMFGQDAVTADLRQYDAGQDKAANEAQNINDQLDKLRSDLRKRMSEMDVRKQEYALAIDDCKDVEKLSQILWELLLSRHELRDSQTYRDLLAEGVRGV